MRKTATIAERVRYVRKRMGLSQARFAMVLGVSVITVSRWERGVMEPADGTILRMALEYLLSTLNK